MSNPFLTSMVKLFLPLHMGDGISIAGFSLEGDSNRMVEVPAARAQELVDHGLVRVPPGVDEEEFALSMASAHKVDQQMRGKRS